MKGNKKPPFFKREEAARKGGEGKTGKEWRRRGFLCRLAPRGREETGAFARKTEHFGGFCVIIAVFRT